MKQTSNQSTGARVTFQEKDISASKQADLISNDQSGKDQDLLKISIKTDKEMLMYPNPYGMMQQMMQYTPYLQNPSIPQQNGYFKTEDTASSGNIQYIPDQSPYFQQNAGVSSVLGMAYQQHFQQFQNKQEDIPKQEVLKREQTSNQNVSYEPYIGGKQETQPAYKAEVDDEEDWEDVPGEQYETVIEFSKCQDLVKMKKDLIIERKRHGITDEKLLGKRTRVLVNDDFLNTLIKRDAECRDERMVGLTSDLLAAYRGKTQWFEGSYYPVVGTSLIFEIPQSTEKPLLLSKMTDHFIISRKHQGALPAPSKQVFANPLVDKNYALNQYLLKQEALIAEQKRSFPFNTPTQQQYPIIPSPSIPIPSRRGRPPKNSDRIIKGVQHSKVKVEPLDDAARVKLMEARRRKVEQV
ncbi:hypothetical protein FGO68_gene822 [Halteria grandinella]|uniref:Uncharacterized protein n=1 Tax=Halteria grandinella TaxID=5974 RepID=A0A8J8T2M7_HALGN|nr:hypothetical protein FGO68_gene822 [Halteria grandinella]